MTMLTTGTRHRPQEKVLPPRELEHLWSYALNLTLKLVSNAAYELSIEIRKNIPVKTKTNNMTFAIKSQKRKVIIMIEFQRTKRL